jgi:hypothetical protein
MGGYDDRELQQADFSNLRVQDMTPQQRAEIRRRYADFVRHFDGSPQAAAQPKAAAGRRISKWVPGSKPGNDGKGKITNAHRGGDRVLHRRGVGRGVVFRIR